MRKYKDIKKNLLKNKNIKKEYEKLDVEFKNGRILCGDPPALTQGYRAGILPRRKEF